MRIVRIAAAVLLISGMAMAQGAGPGAATRTQGGGLTALKTYLNLTDQQVTDIRAVLAASRETVKPLALQVAEKAKLLREALKKDPVDATAVSALRSDIEALRTKIKAARDDAGRKNRSILNSTQLGLLADLEKALSLMPAARGAVTLGLLEPPEGARGLMGPAERGPRAGATGTRVRPPRRI